MLLSDQYKGGGTSSYHPKMLLKILVLAISCPIFIQPTGSGGLRKSIYMMWLAGMARPDHHTINRFRSERLKDVLKEVFAWWC